MCAGKKRFETKRIRVNWKKKQTIKRVKTNKTNKRVSKEIQVCLYQVPRG